MIFFSEFYEDSLVINHINANFILILCPESYPVITIVAITKITIITTIIIIVIIIIIIIIIIIKDIYY